MLNLLPERLIFFNQQGELIYRNRVAKPLIKPITLDQTQQKKLQHHNDQFNAALQRAIDAARSGHKYIKHLIQPAQGPINARLLTLCALDARYEQSQNAAVDLHISGTSSSKAAPKKPLKKFFGLTPAEARIAWAYTRGYRINQIAAKFAISPTTVAFHTRNIYQKTFTNRQAELVALLSTLPNHS